MTATLRRAAAAVALAVAGTLVAAGCGTEPGSGACTETRISAPDVTVDDPLRNLTLEATLRDRDGEPVEGAELAFFVRLRKSNGRTNGVRMGETTTRAGGEATFVRKDGLDGLGFTDERAVGYTVEYNPTTPVEDVYYCRSRTSAGLTVR